MVAVHTPIVLLPAPPRCARHDVFRSGTRHGTWLIHTLECVPAIVICADQMGCPKILARHSGAAKAPRCPGPASKLATRPWLGPFTSQAHVTPMARGREHVPRVGHDPSRHFRLSCRRQPSPKQEGGRHPRCGNCPWQQTANSPVAACTRQHPS